MTDNTVSKTGELCSPREAGSTGLSGLIEQGGVYYGVRGAYPGEILAEITGLLPAFPSLKKEVLLQAIVEREALMSTAIGKGIALPHPRTPLLGEEDKAFAAIAFPAEPLAWNAPDGSKVHTVILIVSSSAQQHLSALSKINFLCQQEQFYSLIQAQAPRDEIIAAIREAERSWAG